MAPIVGKKEATDIWEDILSSLHSRTSNKGNKTVLILGGSRSGKSTLVARMADHRDVGHITRDPGLEFNYLPVKDEDKEIVGRIGVYCASSTHFLSHVLTKDRLSEVLVILAVSLAEPWDLEDNILYWTTVLEQHIKDLNVDDTEMRALQKKVADIFSTYKPPVKKPSPGEDLGSVADEDHILLPVPDGALTTNVGVPILVALTKVDTITTLQKDNDFTEEHFEYIQWHLRKFCLSWGAGLIYCSPRENSNTKLLFDYLAHLLFDNTFNEEAQVIERDGIFVPIGWDNPAKIAVISEGFIQFKENIPFADQIRKLPDVRSKRILKGEDDQLFLARMQAVLAEKQKSPGAQRKSAVESTVESKVSTKTPPPGDGVLANFFNSLLQKKPGSTPSPQTSPSPPPSQVNLMPPKKALAPQLSAPQKSPEPPKTHPDNKLLASSKSHPGNSESGPSKPAEPKHLSSSGTKATSPRPTSKSPSNRDKSPVGTRTSGIKKPGSIPAPGGSKKVVKKQLPQPKK